MELEGLVSKRADSRYRSGRSKDWIKLKNRNHPAMGRVMDSFLSLLALQAPSTFR
jgi:ATP-dependent DNA ligase